MRIASALLLLPLVACGGTTEPPSEGIVVKRTYDDPDDWTTQECSLRDAKGNCTMYRTEHHHDGPHWYVKVYDEARDKNVSVEVGVDVFNACRTGAKWMNGKCVG